MPLAGRLGEAGVIGKACGDGKVCRRTRFAPEREGGERPATTGALVSTAKLLNASATKSI
jgi:hypothetical protein